MFIYIFIDSSEYTELGIKIGMVVTAAMLAIKLIKLHIYGAIVISLKILFIISVFITSLSACAPTRYCTASKNYLAKVDTTKPYNIKGKYCISHAITNNSLRDSVLVYFNVYNRLTGKQVPDGVIWLNNGTVKTLILNGVASLKIRGGECNLGIDALISLPLIIKKIKFKPNTEVEINAYLGSSLQW